MSFSRISYSRKWTLLIWAFLVPVSTSNALARESDLSALTLAEAIQLALEHNPVLRVQEMSVRAAEAGVISASKRINPQLSLNMEGYPLFESTRGSFFDSQELTLRFDQTLELGNKRALRTDVARLETSIAEAQLDAGRQQLVSEVREAYFATVRADRELSIARALLSDMESIVRLNEQRLRVGQISGSEYRRSQLERLSFLEEVEIRNLSLKNAQATLVSVLGFDDLQAEPRPVDPLDTEWPNAADQEIPPRLSEVELIDLAFTNRQDLKAAVRQRDRLTVETQYQKARFKPNLVVGGGYKRDGVQDGVVFGVSLPLRLFDGNEGGIARAQAQVIRSQHQVSFLQRVIRIDVHNALNRVMSAEKRKHMFEQQLLPQAADVRRLAREAYRIGGITLTDFLDVQRSHRTVQERYLKAQFDYRIGLYGLSRALGR